MLLKTNFKKKPKKKNNYISIENFRGKNSVILSCG